MEVYTKKQVKNLLLKQRQICSKAIFPIKKTKKSLKKLCLTAPEPDFPIIKLLQSNKKVSKQKNINWIQVAKSLSKKGLTSRESEILIYSCQSFSTKRIAKKLKISIKTVEWHRRNIFIKLNVKSILSAINMVHYLSK